MELVSRRVIGRGVMRSAGQIAVSVSVAATLIATSIYAGLRHGTSDRGVADTPSLTRGGKYETRIAGAELPPLPEPAPPVLSIVNWAITPPSPTRAIADVAWTGAGEAPAPAMAGVRGESTPRPARRGARRAMAANPPPTVLPPSRPVAVAVAGPQPAPLVPASEHGGSVWSMATATAGRLVSFGGSALRLGSSTLGHLIP